ncbi:CFI-box-CTERM domain-containing protein [Floccifex sp.]|uniref:CFI-box-CTERM domain-containing protein n=1 Tax=Floccifex sp. TaxID=2815810 RepID=UPI003F02CD16
MGTTYNEGFGRSTTSNSSEGCYIATCVYGYDSDEVWTLRKFRDNVLKQHFIGKCFIKAYYFISPKLVHFFGNQQWFHSFFKFILNPLIKKIDSQEPIK